MRKTCHVILRRIHCLYNRMHKSQLLSDIKHAFLSLTFKHNDVKDSYLYVFLALLQLVVVNIVKSCLEIWMLIKTVLRIFVFDICGLQFYRIGQALVYLRH